MSTASAIARFVPDEELDGFSAGQLLEVTKAITMILSIPPAATNHIDAVAVATGQGEEWRFTHAIRAWEANPRLRHLLVTSGNPAERTYTEVTSEDLIPGEVKRILTYLNKGWLATPQELRRYLSWLWSNHGSDWLVP